MQQVLGPPLRVQPEYRPNLPPGDHAADYVLRTAWHYPDGAAVYLHEGVVAGVRPPRGGTASPEL